jgi:ATP-binding cassette subfamily B protein
VFQLLLRYYDPQTGRIALDGVTTRDMALGDLRHRIGIVPQDAVVFSTSAWKIFAIMTDATDENHRAAAKDSVYEFLTRLPG